MEKIKEMSRGKAILQIFIMVFIVTLGQFVGAIPCDLIMPHVDMPSEWMYHAIRTPVYIMAVWILCKLYTEKFFHCRMSDFRITKPSFRIIDFAIAFGLPLFVYLSFSIIGEPIWNTAINGKDITGAILNELAAALLSGITEEILFRGYITKIVEIKWNRKIAVIVPAVVFSLFHIPSMTRRDPLSLILLISGISLVGVLLSLITLRRNCIWGSALIHVVWNFFVGQTIYVSSVKTDFSILFIKVIDNPFLTGAGFGIEASIVAIFWYASFSFLAFYLLKKHEEKNKSVADKNSFRYN